MSEVLSVVINNNIIRMAHLKRVRGGIRIRRLMERECPEGMVDGNIIKKPDAFAGFIRLQMNNANVRVRDVVFTIPADKVMTREVTLPEMSDARIRQIINTNAGEYFPIKLEDYVISFYRVASVKKYRYEFIEFVRLIYFHFLFDCTWCNKRFHFVIKLS